MAISRLAHLEWLFYTPKAVNIGLSSSTSFSPADAYDSEYGWQNTTTPSAIQKKKSIVITKNTFQDYIVDQVALLEWLRGDGFDVYLCLEEDQEKTFHLFTGANDAEKLKHLTYFDAEKDYDNLAKQAARDFVVILDPDKGKTIKTLLDNSISPDKNSNAISTATTLRFHYYPDEILNCKDLAAYLKAATTPQKKEVIFETAKEVITMLSFPEFVQCVNAWPEGVNKLWEFYLANCEVVLRPSLFTVPLLEKLVEAWPDGFDDLIQHFKEKSMLDVLVKAYKKGNPVSPREEKISPPQNFQKRWNELKKLQRPFNLPELDTWLKDWPAGAEIIWEHYTKRKKLQPQQARMGYEGMLIGACISKWPEGLSRLLTELDLNSNQDLIASIAMAPGSADVIWDYYKKNGKVAVPLEELTSLFITWPAGEQKILHYVKEKGYKYQHSDRNRDSNFLFAIKAWPHETKKIVEDYLDIFTSIGLTLSLLKSHFNSIIPLFVNVFFTNVLPVLENSPAFLESNDLDSLVEKILNGLSISTRERYCSAKNLETCYPPFLLGKSPAEINMQEIACLYLGVVRENFLDEVNRFIENHPLKSLSIIEIASCNQSEADHLYRFLEKFHSDKKIAIYLPASAEAWLDREKIPTNFLVLFSSINFSETSSSPAPMNEQPDFSTICIAQNSLSTKFKLESSSLSYELVKAGRFLNPDGKKLSVRTGVIDLNLKDLSQSHVKPTQFVEDTKAIPYSDKNEFENFLKKCEKINVSVGRYAVFDQVLMVKERTRLLSIDAQESCEAFFAEPLNKITIEKGDDGFYYATADEECVLHYVLKAAPEKELLAEYKAIPDDFAPKRIATAFKQNPHYTDVSEEDQAIPTNATGEADWDAIYDQCAGSCRHRVAAVYNKIIESKECKKEDVRMIDIDNNHARLEMKYQGKYFQVDLGGVSGHFSYNTSNAAYQAPPELKRSSAPRSKFFKPKPFVSKPSRVINPTFQAENIDALEEKIFSSSLKRILLATGSAAQLEAQANFLIKEARAKNRAVFFLNDPSVLDIGVSHLWLDKNGQPQLGIHSLLGEFLKTCDENALLVINWEAFNAKQRLQLNHVLGKTCRIQGEVVSNPPKIVGLCHAMPMHDGSFTSRHNLLINTETIFVPDNSFANEMWPTISIDLKGLGNWKEALFGKIIQTKNGTEWQKSELTLCLEKSPNANIEIKNASDPAALARYLKQAKAAGQFAYHGYLIPFDENKTQIYCNNEPFNFKEFLPVHVESNVTTNKILSTTPIIDTYVFDTLLSGKKMEGGTYDEINGLVAEKANQSLTLFISSDLTDAQYYCLCATAKKHNVQLLLQLAPGVTLPKELASIQMTTTNEVKESPHPKVYIQADLLQVKTELQQETGRQKPLVLHVEDYVFSDLIYDIQFDKTQDGFRNFRLLKSAVLSALIDGNGRDVILRGEFSDNLLAELKPFLLGRTIQLPTGEEVTLKGRLKILIESNNRPNLNWLNSVNIVHATQKKPPIPPPIILYQEKNPRSATVDLTDSKKNSDQFIDERKKQLLNGLKKHSIVQLIGESGVGKSHLLADLETECKIYHELSSIIEWAENKDDKTKILFIDEANIEDKHLTIFAPLKEGANAEILYKGKLYPLTEHHKVVCARNPPRYGGGRTTEQNLFRDNRVPEMHFADFPDSYIYERILKPVLQNISPGSEAFWEQRSKELIEEYNQKAERDTVRELQEKLLQEVQALTPSTCLQLDFPAGTPTDEQIQIIAALRTFIDVRKSRHLSNALDQNGLGLNGFLLEGKPGTGKSEMVEYALHSLGYVEATLEDEHKADDTKLYFYRIEPSFSLEKKKNILIKALNEGSAFVVDELNSCIDDGFEKILNAVLTGRHPDTKEKAKKPGCMGLFTANSAGLSGRDLIGPAIRHRCVVKEIGDYNEKGLIPILEKEFPADSTAQRRAKSEEFLYLQQDENWNLRGYLEFVKQSEAVKPPIASP